MCRSLVLLHFWYDFFIPLGSCISTVQVRAGAIALLTVKEAITLRLNPDLSDLVECRCSWHSFFTLNQAKDENSEEEAEEIVADTRDASGGLAYNKDF